MLVLFLLLDLYYASVIYANHKNFKEKVLDEKHVTMVAFKAPWCGHCKNLEPEFVQAAARLDNFAKLVEVDCDNSINRELCARYGVKGYPTIKIFSSGSPTDYQGERKAKAIIDTLLPMIPGKYVKKVGGTAKKSISFAEFKESGKDDQAKVLLVTEKKVVPPLFKVLSIEFFNRLVFGVMKKVDMKDEINNLNISSFPAIAIFPKEKDGKAVLYSGKYKFVDLQEFLQAFALPKLKKEKPNKEKLKVKKPDAEKKKKKAKTEIKEQEAAKLKEFDPTVEELTCQNCLERKCLAKSNFCIIAFLTLEEEYPESIQAFNESIKILQSVKKIYHEKNVELSIVWTNTIHHGRKLIRDFGVSDMFPTLMAIDPKKRHYGLPRGSFEIKSISEFCDSFLTGKHRVEFKEMTLDKPAKPKVEEMTLDKLAKPKVEDKNSNEEL